MKFLRYSFIFCVCIFAFSAHQAFASPTNEPIATPSQVIVIYNTNYTTDSDSNGVQDSLQIANYYKTKRGIPSSNVIGLSMPTTEVISRSDYDTYIRDPLKSALSSAGLTSTTKYIVLVTGDPLKITDTNNPTINFDINGNYGSVDMAIATLNQSSGHETGGRQSNPYYNVNTNFSKTFRFKTSTFTNGSGVTLDYLVTRLDGFTVPQVEGMIDKGYTADTSGTGKFVLDQYNNSSFELDNMTNASNTLTSIGKTNVLNPYSASGPLTTTSGNVIGYTSYGHYAGLPANYYNTSFSFTYLNGAVTNTYESYSGDTFSSSGPTNGFGQVAQFIQAGGSGGIGNVYEPYSDAIANENIWMPQYSIGYTWADAAYMSLPYIDWAEVVVGDPLMIVGNNTNTQAAPTSFTSSGTTSTTTTLNWTNPGSFANITLVRKTGGYPASSTDGTVLYSGSGSTAIYHDSALSSSTTYYYSLFARDADFNYSSPAETQITTSAPVPLSGCSSNGVGTSWNTGADWTGSCTGAGGIPATGDDVTITAGDPITLDIATPVLSSLTIDATLDTSSSNFAINTALLTIDGTGTLTANASTITISGISGALFTNNGIFTAGTSTVAYTGNASLTIPSSSITYYNLSLTPTITTGRTYTLGAMTINNNFTIQPSATAQLLTVNMGGSITVAATGTTTITRSSTATSLLDATSSNYSLTTGKISINTGGTFNAEAATMNLTGTSSTLFTITGTFTAGTSTVNVNGAYSAVIIFNSATASFYNLTFSNSSTGATRLGAMTILSGGTLTVSAGTLYDGNFISNICTTAQVITGTGATLSVSSGATLGVCGTTFSAGYSGFSSIVLDPSSIVHYVGNGTVTIDSTLTYGNLAIYIGASSNSANLSGTTTVLGQLLIGTASHSNTFSTTASNYTLNVGSISIVAGSFNANASTINITGTSGTLINLGNSVTFTAGTSTVNLTGNGSATIDSIVNSTLSFYNLTSSGTGTKTMGASMTVSNVLNVSAGTFSTGSNTLTLSGTTGTPLSVSGTFDTGTGTVAYTGDVSMSIPAITYYNLALDPTITAGRIYTLGAMTINNNFTIQPSATAQLLTVNMGGAISVTGTTTITKSSTATSLLDTTSSNYTLNTGKINIAAGGTFNAEGSTVNITGTTSTLFTLNASGTFTAGTSTVNMTGNGSAAINSGSPSFYNLTSSGTGTKTLGAGITLASGGTLSVTAGEFNPSSYAITASGSNTLSVTNAIIDVPTSWAVTYPAGFTTQTLGAGSTVNYNEGSPQTIDYTPSYVNLTIASTGTDVLNGATTVSGNLTIGSSTTLDPTSSNYALNLGGNFSDSGTFTPEQSTVTLNGAGTQSLTGTNTFYNLTITNGNREIDFPSGTTTTISNTFSANGTAGNLIKLYSSSSPTQWTFAPNGTASVSYVAVMDGACAGTVSYITQSNLTNNGNNGQCWVDTNPPTVPGTPTTITTSPTTTTVLTFTWTASTDSSDGLATPAYIVQYSTDNTFTTNTQTTASTNSSTTPSLSDGTWYIRVKASDVSGNFSAFSSPSSGILIDTTAPTVPGIPTTTSPTTNTTPTFSWTASTDSGSGLATPAYTIQYGTDPTFTTAITTTSNTPSFITPTLTDGTYYLRVKASDVAGNISVYSSNSSGILLDTTAPTVPGIPTTTTPTTNTTPTFSWTASTDSGSGLATTPYTIQYSQDQTFGTNVLSATSATSSFTPGTLSYGTWYIDVKASDLVGNISAYSLIGSVVIYHTSAHAIQTGQYLPVTTTSGRGAMSNGCSIGDVFSVTTGLRCSSTIAPVSQSGSGAPFQFTAPITSKSPKVIIIALQNLLNNDILANLKPKIIADGVWGKKTTLAIKAYQKVHNLYPDAVIGKKTVTVFNGGAGVL